MENIEATDIIAKILETNGVKDAVVSSGSRCLRMVRAVDDNPAITVRMVVDERVAAFMALGISDATQQPVALVCTSGTAMLNYTPAIAEAYYRSVPLIVITADRPPEMIDLNDGQTIHQFHALDNIVKDAVDIDATRCCTKDDFDSVCRIIESAITPCKGPVHINLHLHEGLNPLGLAPFEPYHITKNVREKISDIALNGVSDKDLENKRILIFIGQRYYDRDFDAEIQKLLKCPNVEILADEVSNCRVEGIIRDIDTVMRKEMSNERDLCLDILITIGRTSPISRRFKEWLRNAGEYQHWRITDKNIKEDTYLHLNKTVVTDDVQFLRWLNCRMCWSSGKFFERPWKEMYLNLMEKKKAVLPYLRWGDLYVIYTISKALPSECVVESSNGMSVRNLSICMEGSHIFMCNRGVNGIDGSTSTALGYSIASDKLTVLISGDMSALYDISALFSGYLNPRFKMVIIANGGGEIFRAIPATSSYKSRERLLCKIPDVEWRDVAKSVGMEYFEATAKNELDKILPDFFRIGEKASILVIKTSPDNNGLFDRGLIEYASEFQYDINLNHE